MEVSSKRFKGTSETFRAPCHTNPLRNRHVNRHSAREPLRLAQLSSSLGGLCTGQSAQFLVLGARCTNVGKSAQLLGP